MAAVVCRGTARSVRVGDRDLVVPRGEMAIVREDGSRGERPCEAACVTTTDLPVTPPRTTAAPVTHAERVTVDAAYQPPVAMSLPRADGRTRARRLARTVAVFAKRIGPPLLRPARREPQAVARALRESFEELGATYVKFGQLVGSSPGAFGAATSNEFRSCLDRGPSVPFPAVRALVEAELGQPMREVFLSFDPEPLASASIAVVHRATLVSGDEVAVKVLRPGIRELVTIDLDIMEPLFKFFALQGVPAAGPLFRFLSGFRRQVAEELDLRNEARTMEHFRAIYAEAGLDEIVVPAPRISTPSVLVMDLLDGVPIDDPDRIAELGHDPAPLVQALLRSWFLTGLRDGLFHGDIHAGNLMLLRDGRIGLVDWGIIGVLDARTRRIFRRFVEAILGDPTGWADVQEFISELLPQGPDAEQLPRRQRGPDEDEFKEIEDLLTKPFGEVDLTGAFSGPGAPRAGERHSLKERLERVRRLRRWRKQAFGSGLIDSEVLQADFLLFKQLLYFERYGKMYLSQVALLPDRDFLEGVLAAAQRRTEEGPHNG